jgi:hypothetical protein
LDHRMRAGLEMYSLKDGQRIGDAKGGEEGAPGA